MKKKQGPSQAKMDRISMRMEYEDLRRAMYKKFRVQVVRHERAYQSIVVEAVDAKQARTLAVAEAKQNPDNFCDNSYGRITAGTVTPLEGED